MAGERRGAVRGGAGRLEEEAHPWLLLSCIEGRLADPSSPPSSNPRFVSTKHSGDKVLVFERGSPAGPLVFVFNFSPARSYEGYRSEGRGRIGEGGGRRLLW